MLRSDDSAFSTGSPFTRWAKLAIFLATVSSALALGCTPKIGDDCTVSTNCSSTGDRLCDVTQPGGYCTKFNCEPGSCPEDSVCVNFGTKLSIVPTFDCAPSQANSPYKRSFCLASCSSNSDCRGGYECLLPEDFHAVLAEHSSGNRVCTVKPKPLPSGTTDDVCTGSDAGVEPELGGGGSSGAAQGGSSSSGGSGDGGDGGSGDGGDGGSGDGGDGGSGG